MIPKGHHHNFNSLMRAAAHGHLALMECQDATTGRITCVIVMLNTEEDGSTSFVPVAKLFDGNPYEEILPPADEAPGFVAMDDKTGPPILIGMGEHRYAVECTANGYPDTPLTIQVDAQNRTQASATAKLYGYTVRSVNMVG
jgi:hypothetical protein